MVTKKTYQSAEEISEQARLKALEADRIKNMEAAISQKAGVNKEYAATLRTQLEKDPKTFGYKTKDEYEARLKDPEFTQKKEVADATAAAQAKAHGVDHEFTVKRQKAWEKFQAEEKDKEIAQKINDQVPAPDYKKAAGDARDVQFDIKQQQLDADRAASRAQTAVDNASTVQDKVDAEKQLAQAKKSQDVAYGRTGEPVKKDEPQVAAVDPKKDPVAVPGNDSVAKSDDPCSNPKMSHRQAEDCSMKKLTEAKDDADKNVARCFYSGFAANNNAATNKCSAVKSTGDAKRLGISLKGVKDTDCGSGMVMCNPLVFGVQQDKSAICVGNTKKASEDCATKANLKSPEAQARYKELMKENENKAKLAELEKKLKRSCSDEEMKIDRAFTQNIKIRNDKEDHQKTCEVLGKAIVNAKDVTKDVAAAPLGTATRSILPDGGVQGATQ